MKKISILLLVIALLASCSRQVTRVGENTTIDLSGRWNDTDSRLVAEEMVKDGLRRVWLEDYVNAKKQKPTVIIGIIYNKTSEHISAETFIKDIEREFINSGQVRLVQGGEAREQLRTERADQQDYSSPESLKKWGRENGADFMMTGSINSITDQYKKEKVVYYQIDLELSNLETNEKVWIGNKKIKKVVKN